MRSLSYSEGHSVFLLVVAAILGLAAVPRPSKAQSRPAAENAKGVQIFMLGTKGGPPLLLHRSEPSTLLVVDGRRYMIDCGIGTMRRLVRADIPSQSIRTIFITHNHPDHDLGLIDVMGNDFNARSSLNPGATINIYGPPQTGDLVRAALSYLDIPFGVFRAEVEAQGATSEHPADIFKAHNIDSAGLIFQDDKIRVTAAENTHFMLLPAKDRTRMKSYAYRFDTPYGAIVFTGDTGPSNAVTRLARGAAVLVSEVIDVPAITKWVDEQNQWPQKRKDAAIAHLQSEHLPTKDLGEMATTAQVKSVLLTHLSIEGLSLAEAPAIFVSGVKKYYSGPVFAGEDLARYCLDASNAGGTGGGTLRPCQ